MVTLVSFVFDWEIVFCVCEGLTQSLLCLFLIFWCVLFLLIQDGTRRKEAKLNSTNQCLYQVGEYAHMCVCTPQHTHTNPHIHIFCLLDSVAPHCSHNILQACTAWYRISQEIHSAALFSCHLVPSHLEVMAVSLKWGRAVFLSCYLQFTAYLAIFALVDSSL